MGVFEEALQEYKQGEDVKGLIAQNFPADAQGTANDVMQAESSGDPNAFNPKGGGKGAIGLFQIRAQLHEKKLKDAGIIKSTDDLYDPETNIKAAALLHKESGFTPWAESQGKWDKGKKKESKQEPDVWAEAAAEYQPSFIDKAQQFTEDYYKWLQSPVEVHSASEWVANLPKNISATVLGIPVSTYQAAKSVTDPFIQAAFEQDTAPLEKLPENAGEVLHGFATSIGEPLGMYGFQQAIDRWVKDPVGTLVSLLMLKGGFEGGKVLTAEDVMKHATELAEKASSSPNTKLFNRMAREKLGKGDVEGAAEDIDKVFTDDELRAEIAKNYQKSADGKDTAAPHDVIDSFDEAAGFTDTMEDRMKAKSALNQMGLLDEEKQRYIDKVMPDSLDETLRIKRMVIDKQIEQEWAKEDAVKIEEKPIDERTPLEQDRADLINLINNNRNREVTTLWNNLLEKQSSEAQSPVQFEQLRQALSTAEKDGQVKPEYVQFWEDALAEREKGANSSKQAQALKGQLAELEKAGQADTPEYAKLWDQMLGKQDQARQSVRQYQKLKEDLKASQEEVKASEESKGAKEGSKETKSEGAKVESEKERSGSEQKVESIKKDKYEPIPKRDEQTFAPSEPKEMTRARAEEIAKGGGTEEEIKQVKEQFPELAPFFEKEVKYNKKQVAATRLDAIALSKGFKLGVSDSMAEALSQMHPDLAEKIGKVMKEDGGIEKSPVNVKEGATPTTSNVIKPKFNIREFLSKPLEAIEEHNLSPEDARELTKKADYEANSARIDELNKLINDQLKDQLSMGLDPEIAKHFVELGYRYMKKGIVDFKDWVAEFKKDMGDIYGQIEPHLQDIYNSAKTRFERSEKWVKAMPTPNILKQYLHNWTTSTQTLEAYTGPHEEVIHNVGTILTEGAQIPKQMWVVEKFEQLNQIMKGIHIDPNPLTGRISRIGKEANLLGREVFHILDKYDNPSLAKGYSPEAIKIATDLRGWMDDILSEMKENGVTDKNGHIITRLDSYIHHMMEDTNIAEDIRNFIKDAWEGKADDQMGNVTGTSDINGFAKPTPRLGAAEKRTGKLENYETNPLTVLRRYVLASSRVVFDKPAIEAARGQIEKLPSGYWKKFAEDTVREYMPISDIASRVQARIAQMGARSVLWWSTGLQTVHVGRVMTQIFPELGLYRTLRSTSRVLMNPEASLRIHAETKAAGLLPQETVPMRFKTGSEVLDYLGNYLDAGNTIAKMIAYDASKMKMAKEFPNLSPKDLMIKSAKEAIRVEGIPNPATRVPGLTKIEKIGIPLVQFKYWAQKYFELGGRAVAAAAKDPSWSSGNLQRVGRYMIGGYLAEQITKNTGVKVFHLSAYIIRMGSPFGSLLYSIGNNWMSDSKTAEEKIEFSLKKVLDFGIRGGQSIPREINQGPTAYKK